MSFEYCDVLEVDALDYKIDVAPLESELERCGIKFAPIWPVSRQGFLAKWRVEEGRLKLIDLWTGSSPVPPSLASTCKGMQGADWFSGLIHGQCGKRRFTGYPSRSFSDREIVLEIVSGKVRRQWFLDLRAIPNQTDDELRRSVPNFLWPERLK